jgi:uncharacterized protein (TIGR02285 family)
VVDEDAMMPAFPGLRASRPALAVLTAALMVVLGARAGVTMAAEPEINWYLYDLPPFVINEGPQKGTGFVDQILRKQLIPALAGYRHRIIVVPLQRLSLMLKTDPAACNPALLKNPEREQFMTFSSPYMAVIPGGAFVRRADGVRLAPYVDASGKLALSRILEDGKATVGIDSARSYGAAIDGVIKPYKEKGNIFGLSTPDATKSLLQMVAGGRIYLALAQPFEQPYYFGHKAGEQALRFYPLAEQADYVLNHTVCAKGEFGQEVIRKVNALWAQPKARAAVTGYYAGWLDEEARPLALRLEATAFAEAAKP